MSAAACVPQANARGTMTLQGTTFQTDTVAHYYVGPGITHTALTLTTTGRTVRVYAASYNRAEDSGNFGAIRVAIGNDSCRNAESVTSMAKRKSNDDIRYLAGINADFFITSSFASQHEFGNAILGYPNMSCAIDGKIAAPDMIDKVSRENALIIGSEGWWIDATDLSYKILNNDGSVNINAAAVNYPRRDNEVVVYNSYAGKYTGTAAGGREIALTLAEGAKWRMNASVKFTVASETPHTGGNLAIPADGIVISCGKNYSNDFIDGLKKGDIVKLKIVCKLPAFENIKPDITDIVGGDVRILNCGNVTTSAIRWINTPSAKYARSLVGYSQDRNLMVMAAVDGNGSSSGLTYYESADLMAALGCYDALDFDGGGSTALYLSHAGIVNQPRDGSERAVGNALYFAVRAPRDNKVASIRFNRHALTLPVYGSYTPTIYGYNTAGELVDTDVRDVVFSCPEALGVINEDGSLMVTGAGTHALTATTADGLTTSIAVTADNSFAAQTDVKAVLVDQAHTFAIPLSAIVDGKACPLSPKAFEWTVENPEIAEVDAENGTIHGLANGTTTLNIDRGDIHFSIPVTVEIASSATVSIVNNLVAEGSKVSKTGTSAVTVTPLANGFTAEFDVTSVRGTRVGFSNEILLYGLPDYIETTVRANQGAIAEQYITMKSASETRTTNIKPASSAVAQGEVSTIRYDLEDTYDIQSASTFPLRLSGISISPAVGSDDSRHCLYTIEDVRAGYDNYSSVEAVGTTASEAALRYIIGADGITTAVPADLYNTRGILLSRGTSHPLPAPGIYILRTSGAVAKILVH